MSSFIHNLRRVLHAMGVFVCFEVCTKVMAKSKKILKAKKPIMTINDKSLEGHCIHVAPDKFFEGDQKHKLIFFAVTKYQFKKAKSLTLFFKVLNARAPGKGPHQHTHAYYILRMSVLIAMLQLDWLQFTLIFFV